MARISEPRLDAAFDALANAQRREVLVSLRSGPVRTPQIASRFGFSKQALSRHISVLEEAGLIDRATTGRTRELSLVTAPLDEITHWLSELQRGWRASFERLDRVLRGQDD